MKVLVTGAKGQLGSDVIMEMERRQHTVIGVGSKEMDITDAEKVASVLRECRPDAVIHCAAWTAVDQAEDCETDAYRVNAAGTENLAKVCKELGCKMMYISTDYVFDGEGEEPWSPEDNTSAPLNVYGKTKLAGEQAVRSLLERYFIVRIAWVFGKNGANFVKTMLRVGENHEKLTVVDDQIGTPTYTRDLARLLGDMIETERYGCYHATNEGGYISWYEFAKEIFRQAAALGHEVYGEDRLQMLPVTTEAYGISKAKRPKNSRLNKEKLVEQGFQPLPEWKDALARYLQEIGL